MAYNSTSWSTKNNFSYKIFHNDSSYYPIHEEPNRSYHIPLHAVPNLESYTTIDASGDYRFFYSL